MEKLEQLILAAKNNDLLELSRLIDGGIDVNAANSNHLTALMQAAACGHISAVEILLQAGAKNSIGLSPVSAYNLAQLFGHAAVIEVLERYAKYKTQTLVQTENQVIDNIVVNHESNKNNSRLLANNEFIAALPRSINNYHSEKSNLNDEAISVSCVSSPSQGQSNLNTFTEEAQTEQYNLPNIELSHSHQFTELNYLDTKITEEITASDSEEDGGEITNFNENMLFEHTQEIIIEDGVETTEEIIAEDDIEIPEEIITNKLDSSFYSSIDENEGENIAFSVDQVEASNSEKPLNDDGGHEAEEIFPTTKASAKEGPSDDSEFENNVRNSEKNSDIEEVSDTEENYFVDELAIKEERDEANLEDSDAPSVTHSSLEASISTVENEKEENDFISDVEDNIVVTETTLPEKDNNANVSTHQVSIEELFDAVEINSLNALKNLIEQGADINIADSYGWTPLMLAARQDKLRIAEYLISHGAQINKVSLSGWTALRIAASSGYLDMVKTLITAGADIHFTNVKGETALSTAQKYGQNEVVIYLKEFTTV